jgi:hypothetical protein
MSTTRVSNSFPWAPKYYENLQRQHRTTWGELIPEIAFVIYLCNAIRNKVRIERIAAQANATYPEDFFTWVDGKKVPDLALIHLVLAEATATEWKYALGDWEGGWRLTKKGLRFAKDIERRRNGFRQRHA